jgi:aspartyl-tRNA synthetase
LGLRSKEEFKPLWVVDFPMFEHDEATDTWQPAHHPFTSPKKESMPFLTSNPAVVRANCYDFVLNGVELASGSIRIHNKDMQMEIFKAIGLTEEQADVKFGFILNAFEYGAPPHGGIGFGFDRLCAMILSGNEYIRDFIAFPKNNTGRDTMLDAPAPIDDEQCKELNIKVLG